jgi:hypothetical protein
MTLAKISVTTASLDICVSGTMSPYPMVANVIELKYTKSITVVGALLNEPGKYRSMAAKAPA